MAGRIPTAGEGMEHGSGGSVIVKNETPKLQPGPGCIASVAVKLPACGINTPAPEQLPPPSSSLGENEEHINGGGGSFAIKNKRRNSTPVNMPASLLEATMGVASFMMSQQNHISISTGGGLELTEVISTGFQVPDNSSTMPQGGNGDVVGITIDPPTEQLPGGNNDDIENMNPTNERANISSNISPKLLSRALLTVSLLTLSLVAATAFYKAPRGVVFGHHRLVYYLTLTGILFAGIVEALTGIWISRSDDVHERRFSFGRIVLCGSIGPFVTIVAIGGFAFIDA